MTSEVDETFPRTNEVVNKAEARTQALIIKNEISALQALGTIAGQLAFGPLTPLDQQLRVLRNLLKNNVINIPTIIADSGGTTSMTEAVLFSGIHAKDPAAAINYQVPTGTEISAQFVGNPAPGDSFEFTLINTGNSTGEDITLTVDTGVTFVGSAVLAPAADDPGESSSATWIVRNVSAVVWVFHRK